MVVMRRKGRSSTKTVISTAKGEATRTMPSTRVRFVTLEPMMSPIASCTRPRLTAVKSNVSSGREVPIETILAPIRIGGTPQENGNVHRGIDG